MDLGFHEFFLGSMILFYIIAFLIFIIYICKRIFKDK